MYLPSAEEAVDDGDAKDDKNTVKNVINSAENISSKLEKYLLKGTNNLEDLYNKVQEAKKVLNDEAPSDNKSQENKKSEEVEESVMKRVNDLHICDKLKSDANNILGKSAKILDLYSVDVKAVYYWRPELNISYTIELDLYNKLGLSKNNYIHFSGEISEDNYEGYFIISDMDKRIYFIYNFDDGTLKIG